MICDICGCEIGHQSWCPDYDLEDDDDEFDDEGDDA